MSAAVPVVPEQVTEARDSMFELAKTLRETERVRPRGVAMVQRLLSDSDSALYTNTARGAVELQVQAALGALVERKTASEPAVTVESAGPATTTRHEARPRQRPRGGLA
jgi:hypothetical protein